jgi:hypothetical protein
MSEVTLYDSRGYPLDDPDGERNEKIRNMSRYGVVFTIADAQPFELATYFRAYESSSGRMEQYYATYTTASDHALLREFREAVIDVAETDHGLEIERSESGENILSNLDTSDPGQVGTDRQRSRARELLSSGERLRFGVGSYEKAFKFIGEVGGARVGMEIAVTEGESTPGGPMSTYDLIIEKGPYMGLEPLGQTQALMNPEPDLSDEDPDGDPIPEIAIDIGYGVAAVVLLALVYIAAAGLLFQLGLATPWGAAETPLGHDVTVEFNDSTQAVEVDGGTAANKLTLEYINESNSTPLSTYPLEVGKNGELSHTNRSIPPQTDYVRVRYSGVIQWTVGSTEPFSVGNNEALESSDTPTPESTTASSQSGDTPSESSPPSEDQATTTENETAVNDSETQLSSSSGNTTTTTTSANETAENSSV